MTSSSSESRLSDRDWKILLDRINHGKCTPFLGAGACHGALPLGGDIAQEWAREFHYPLSDRHDLARVAQYVAVLYDAATPKERIIRRFDQCEPPDFTDRDEPHMVLAGLPLPVYLTTNYDDFMTRALRRQGKEPQRELYRWNGLVRQRPSDRPAGYRPSPETPLVFHLHGHNEDAYSLVLTEEDYLEYLVNLSKSGYELPPRVLEALGGTSLLFVGYSLTDWSFRVLFRMVLGARTIQHRSVTVQLPPPAADASGDEKAHVQEYLNAYFGRNEMSVYWGTAREFMAELRQRWSAFQDGR